MANMQVAKPYKTKQNNTPKYAGRIKKGGTKRLSLKNRDNKG